MHRRYAATRGVSTNVARISGEGLALECLKDELSIRRAGGLALRNPVRNTVKEPDTAVAYRGVDPDAKVILFAGDDNYATDSAMKRRGRTTFAGFQGFDHGRFGLLAGFHTRHDM